MLTETVSFLFTSYRLAINAITLRPLDAALVGASFFLLIIASRTSAFLMILVQLLGTSMHEISHFILAILSGSSPTGISIIPKRTESGWTLGSVGFHPGFWTGALVALAPPLALVPLADIIWHHYMIDVDLPRLMMLSYLVASCLWSALPSRVDWMIAFKYPAGLPLVGFIAWMEILILS